jgi:nitroimidazol reductase NimA-like FMN-containing flavoprotein (pyridoxamine 5'-phosphate oxidase superfamily)
MTPEEIRAFLSHGTRTAKVATSGPGGQPHVMPVWFALDGEEFVLTTWGDEELLRFATAIGGRYMGADRAEEFGRRKAVPASC